MFQVVDTFSYALAVERSPELRLAMRSQISLNRDIDTFVDLNLRPNIEDKYIKYSTHIWGGTPEFNLGINIPPYQGMVLLEVYSPLQQRYGGRRFDGFEVRLTTDDERQLLQPQGLITIQRPAPEKEQTFRAQIANSSFTMFGSIATHEFVRELRSLSGVQQIERVRYGDPDDSNSPWCTDKAAESGKRIVQEIPIEDLKHGAQAVPVYGALQLEWHQHGYDVELLIGEDGRVSELWIHHRTLGLDIEQEFAPSLSVDKFLSQLDLSLQSNSTFVSTLSLGIKDKP